MCTQAFRLSAGGRFDLQENPFKEETGKSAGLSGSTKLQQINNQHYQTRTLRTSDLQVIQS
jgi:hypothetical protein